MGETHDFRQLIISSIFAAVVMILMLGLVVWIMLKMGDGDFHYAVRRVESLKAITLVH